MTENESRMQNCTLLARTATVKPPPETPTFKAAAVLATLAAVSCATPRVTGGEPWMKSQGARVTHASSGGAAGPSENHAAYAGRRPLDIRRGRATYYSDSLAGNRTASGEVYDPRAFSAASRDLPFGTMVRVVRVDNGRSVIVRVNDRGPFRDRSRILDLSKAAAQKLNMLREGVVDVRAEILEFGNQRARR